MTVGIYKFYDTRNGECLYVGQSKDIEGRRRRHLSQLRRSKHTIAEFSAWYQENGEFIGHEVLEICENNDLAKNQREMYWFNQLKPRFYKKLPNSNEKWEHSAETREKISKSLLARSGRDKAAVKFYYGECLMCKKSFSSKEDTLVNICRQCHKKCADCILRIEYQEKLVKYYVEERISIRTIYAMYNQSISKGKISSLLKSAGVNVQNTSHLGREMNKNSVQRGVETRAKNASKERAMRGEPPVGYAICANDDCKAEYRKTSSRKQYCSDECISVVRFKRKPRVALAAEELYTLWIAERKTIKEIASLLNCSNATVINLLKQHSIPRGSARFSQGGVVEQENLPLNKARCKHCLEVFSVATLVRHEARCAN